MKTKGLNIIICILALIIFGSFVLRTFKNIVEEELIETLVVDLEEDGDVEDDFEFDVKWFLSDYNPLISKPQKIAISIKFINASQSVISYFHQLILIEPPEKSNLIWF